MVKCRGVARRVIRGVDTVEGVAAKVRDLVTPVLGDAKCSALIDKMMKIDAVKDLRELRPSLQRT